MGVKNNNNKSIIIHNETFAQENSVYKRMRIFFSFFLLEGMGNYIAAAVTGKRGH